MVRAPTRVRAAYIVDDAEYPRRLLRIDATERFGRESGYDRPTMEMFFAQRARIPDRPGKRDRRRAAVARPARRRAVVTGVRRRTARVAHRMLGHRAEPPGCRVRHPGRRQRLDLPAPRVLRDAEALTRRPPLRPGTHAHTWMMGLDGRRCPEPGQPGVQCKTARGRYRSRCGASGTGAQHYRADRMWTDAVLERRRPSEPAGAPRWRPGRTPRRAGHRAGARAPSG